MSNFRIQLKKSVSAEAMNKVLKALGIQYLFNSQTENKAWLKDINSNPDSHQAHLKPKGRDFTMQELKDTFKAYTKVGLMNVDLSFGRCEDAQMKKLAKFVFENQDSIRFVKDAQELIERGEITTKKHIEILNTLDKKRLPLLQRPESMRRSVPTSGQMLAKTWGAGDSRVWLLFGNVKKDSPVFLKQDKYVRQSANNLCKDKEGRAFLLMPLYDFSPNFAEVVSEAIQKMSIREHPNYVMCAMYNCLGIVDVKGMADSFAEFYTKEELAERFSEQFNKIIRTHGMHGTRGISFDGTKNVHQFKSNNGHHQNEANLLNSLILALSLYSKDIAYKLSSDLVNEVFAT